MESNPVLKIKSAGPINEANIDIKKINIIGGVNGSGKTTVAKVLYCFLKVFSSKREQYLHKEFISEMNNFMKILSYSGIVKINHEFDDTVVSVKNLTDNFIFTCFFEDIFFNPF